MKLVDVFKRFRGLWDSILTEKDVFAKATKRGNENFKYQTFYDALLATGWDLRHARYLVTRTKKTYKDCPSNKGPWEPTLLLAAAKTKMFRDYLDQWQ